VGRRPHRDSGNDGRARHGRRLAGAAFILPLALALLTTAFPPEKRGTAIGMFSAVTGISVALGPIIGGAIVHGIDWSWIFWINVPIGLLAIPFVLARLEESFGKRVALDIAGVALITAAALGLVWGLVRGNSAGWGSAEVLGSLIAGALFALAFVRWELRAREPMLPMSSFRSRTFTAGNAAVFFVTGSLSPTCSSSRSCYRRGSTTTRSRPACG
jgi:hypothetical protein